MDGSVPDHAGSSCLECFRRQIPSGNWGNYLQTAEVGYLVSGKDFESPCLDIGYCERSGRGNEGRRERSPRWPTRSSDFSVGGSAGGEIVGGTRSSEPGICTIREFSICSSIILLTASRIQPDTQAPFRAVPRAHVAVFGSVQRCFFLEGKDTQALSLRDTATAEAPWIRGFTSLTTSEVTQSDAR